MAKGAATNKNKCDIANKENGASKDNGMFARETKKGPAFIWVPGPDTLASSSSLTDSQVTTTDSSSSSMWSFSQPKPPKSIKVTNSVEPISFPYAQLCFDPETKTLVTLMEINLAGNCRRSERLRIIDPIEQEANLPSDMPEIQRSCPSGSESTVNTFLDLTYEETKYDDPIILSELSQEPWLEDQNLDLYLLHESSDPWEFQARGGCAEKLKKILTASRSLVVFKPRDSHWEPTQEPFSGIEYAFLEEV